jgi:hypothetical protein
MNCSRCGAKVRFLSGGMGNSSAPGLYFWTGVIASAIALFAVVSHAWIVARVFCIAAAVFIGWSFVAKSEGLGNRCPRCDHPFKSHPWSL